MESFWLAETLKYFYLLFSETSDLEMLGAGLTTTVANTEAHFLPRFGIEGSKVWKTGWQRSSRVKLEEKVVEQQPAVGVGVPVENGEAVEMVETRSVAVEPTTVGPKGEESLLTLV